MIEPASYRPSVSMLGWALNEQDNLREYIDRAESFLRQVSDDFELILFDDGSTDRTWDIACELQSARPWLRLIKNGENRGSGYCYRRGIKEARKKYFLAQTVDWAYDLSELGRSFDLLGQYDVLQGVRAGTLSLSGMLTRSDNAFKAFVSIVNYTLIRILFRLPLADYQNVTVCPTHLIQPVTLEADSSFANPEVLLNAWWQGASFKEIPVPFNKRLRGQATGTRWRRVAKSIFEIWRCWFRLVVLGKRVQRGRGTVVSAG